MAAAVAAVLSLASVVPAQATADALDQSQTLTLSFQRGIALMAQTFTAGATGQLDRVSLASDTTTGFANISVSIQSVSSILAPSGTPLGTSAFSGSVTCCRQFHSFAFNPAIAITASSGTVTKTGTSTGTWSWTAASSDEASSQAVTITANDGQGHSTTTSFTSTVTAVAPTARIVTDPPSIPEGAPETFTGAASSPAEAD